MPSERTSLRPSSQQVVDGAWPAPGRRCSARAPSPDRRGSAVRGRPARPARGRRARSPPSRAPRAATVAGPAPRRTPSRRRGPGTWSSIESSAVRTVRRHRLAPRPEASVGGGGQHPRHDLVPGVLSSPSTLPHPAGRRTRAPRRGGRPGTIGVCRRCRRSRTGRRRPGLVCWLRVPDGATVGTAGTVDSVVPAGFAGYARLLHPVTDRRVGDDSGARPRRLPGCGCTR